MEHAEKVKRRAPPIVTVAGAINAVTSECNAETLRTIGGLRRRGRFVVAGHAGALRQEACFETRPGPRRELTCTISPQ
jgi:hypothetical protein